MHITADAIAGTLESSDLMVRVAPAANASAGSDHREVVIVSTVAAQFGDQIRSVVDEVLDRLEIASGVITIEDKGALDCTIRARVQAAILRGAGITEPDWSLL